MFLFPLVWLAGRLGGGEGEGLGEGEGGRQFLYLPLPLPAIKTILFVVVRCCGCVVKCEGRGLSYGGKD